MSGVVLIFLVAALIGLSLFCLRFSGSDVDEDEQDRQIREAL